MLDEFQRGTEFQLLLLPYEQALIALISQTAVCNRLHSVEQQYSRSRAVDSPCLRMLSGVRTEHARLLG